MRDPPRFDPEADLLDLTSDSRAVQKAMLRFLWLSACLRLGDLSFHSQPDVGEDRVWPSPPLL